MLRFLMGYVNSKFASEEKVECQEISIYYYYMLLFICYMYTATKWQLRTLTPHNKVTFRILCAGFM